MIALEIYNPETGEVNDSLEGDFLWSRNNYGEARPDVMTPLTWSVSGRTYDEISLIPGYRMAGNICGRFYANISVMYSITRAMGQNKKAALKQISGLLGNVPGEVEVPRIKFTFKELLSAFPKIVQLAKKEKEGRNRVPGFLKNNPVWCGETAARIKGMGSTEELAVFWEKEFKPKFANLMWVVGGGYAPYEASMKLQEKLVKLVGEENANALLSGLSSETELLASLGPVVAIAKVVKGEMSRGAYLMQFGHRSPTEMELSAPRPSDDPEWLECQIAAFEKSPVDVEGMLARQGEEFKKAWRKLVNDFPRAAEKLKPEIDAVGPAARLREAIRSEMTRTFGLIRDWALRCGSLTGLEDSVFFFNIDELLDLLKGIDRATGFIDARKRTYDCYRAMPPYPMVIRGPFDPEKWMGDPHRRNDVYHAYGAHEMTLASTIKGFAGAAGVVEGVVRVLKGPEEGTQLQTGEILVAVTTNVGWTPIFPRAAAVITDVGAPLSHAAIVARELGIPAVVGCGEATTRLKTGDRVRVNGGEGVVTIL